MTTEVKVRSHCFLLDDAAIGYEHACWKVKDMERHGAVDESKRCVKVEQLEMPMRAGCVTRNVTQTTTIFKF